MSQQSIRNYSVNQMEQSAAEQQTTTICQQHNLQVSQPKIQLIPTNAIDLQSVTLNTIENISFSQQNSNANFSNLSQAQFDSFEFNNSLPNLPNFNQLFDQLEQAMEQFWEENNRSMSLIRFYLNNLTQQVNHRKQQIQIKKLPKCTVRTSGKECSICLSKIKKCSKVHRLHCKHVFHQKCLSKWISQKSNCPLCRELIE